MNDCIHSSPEQDYCAIFGFPCSSPTEAKGCYFSVAMRDQMLAERVKHER